MKGLFDFLVDPVKIGWRKDVREKFDGTLPNRLRVRAVSSPLHSTKLWQAYCMKGKNMAPNPPLPDTLMPLTATFVTDTLAKCQHFRPLDPAHNEHLLFHGLGSSALASVERVGFDERYCGGILGHGLYLAERPCKSDQYCQTDAVTGLMTITVCRVMLGNCHRICEKPSKKMGTTRRADKINERSDSVVLDIPDWRYREYVVSQIYSEYVVSYVRERV